eukprot:Phypoly_transcript_09367.p2 GENE.Phypoly_transcript_09367~~Phypoly_transcript_09367.p2  ORF type:complete len:118 (-),score=21.25 Phypoly_transcript_09367:283-636(-)
MNSQLLMQTFVDFIRSAAQPQTQIQPTPLPIQPNSATQSPHLQNTQPVNSISSVYPASLSPAVNTSQTDPLITNLQNNPKNPKTITFSTSSPSAPTTVNNSNATSTSDNRNLSLQQI